MMRLWPCAAFALLGTIASTPVAAAAPDTWVSATGADSGNCAAAAPCRTLQYALSQTRKGGVIAVRSSGSFDGVRINNKWVTIVADGVVAILRTAASCGAVVCINSGNVTLRGLIIDPMGRGVDGIVVSNVGMLHVSRSTIRQTGTGIRSNGTSAPFYGEIDIDNSTITESEQAIKIVTKQHAKLSLVRTRIHDNADGISLINAGAGTIVASIADSLIAGQGGYGIHAVGPAQTSGAPPAVGVTVDRTAVLDNGIGVAAAGSGARVRIGNSTITGNAVALRSIGGGAIPSYGTNKLDGNGSGEAPTVTIANQ